MTKKLISIVLIFACVLFSSAKANAASATSRKTIEVSELTLYEEMKNTSDEELLSKDLSTEQIAEIREFDLTQEFKTRASLSNETLLNMGYTAEEITTLKTLANQPEFTEEDIMTSSLEATLTLTLTDVYTNPRYFAYTFTYRWSKVPIFRETDVIAVTWAGCTSTGSYTTIAIDESYSYMNIRYYDYYSDSTFDVRHNWYPVNEYSAAKLEFPLEYGANPLFSTDIFTTYGSGRIELDVVGSQDIYELYFRLGYGHTTIAISPSVSFSGTDASVSFSFEGTTTEEALISVRRNIYDSEEVG